MKKPVLFFFFSLIFLYGFFPFVFGEGEKKKIVILGFQSEKEEYSGVDLSQKLGEFLFSQNKYEILTPPMVKDKLNILKEDWPGYDDWDKIKKAGERLNADLVFWGKTLNSEWEIKKGFLPPYPVYRFHPEFNFSVQIFLYETSSQKLLLYKKFELKEKGGKRISVFSFDREDPDLLPSAKDKENIEEKCWEELAQKMTEEIEKNVK